MEPNTPQLHLASIFRTGSGSASRAAPQIEVIELKSFFVDTWIIGEEFERGFRCDGDPRENRAMQINFRYVRKFLLSSTI